MQEKGCDHSSSCGFVLFCVLFHLCLDEVYRACKFVCIPQHHACSFHDCALGLLDGEYEEYDEEEYDEEYEEYE